MQRRVPVFVISYNRGALLGRTIRSYLKLDSVSRIIIHDNGSDDPSTLNVLKILERSGAILIKRGRRISEPDDLDEVSRTVEEYFSKYDEPTGYVVSDCDIDMSAAAPNALSVYAELLDQFSDAECVGPMLTIRDVPAEYPLFNEVMNRHIEQFWQQEPAWATTSAGNVAYLRAKIDTTFALHRKGDTFHRQKNGLRVYFPYEARHLDWYEWGKGSAYLLSSSPRISHWSNAEFYRENLNAARRSAEFNYVDRSERGGALTVKRWRIEPESRPAMPAADASMAPRVAVITPYHAEPLEMLRGCHDSVARQTVPCLHVMVADGQPRDEMDAWAIDHVRLPRSHGDIGSTPRLTGCYHAIGLGCTAVAFLDADNWYREDHIESLVRLQQETGAGFVSSSRVLCRLDGSVMGPCPNTDPEKFIDTSCMMLMRPAFGLLAQWVLMPAYAHAIGDRVLLHFIRQSRIGCAHTGLHTVFYRCSKAGAYRQLGEPAPADLRPAPDYGGAHAQWVADGNPPLP